MPEFHMLIATQEQLTPERIDELNGLDGVRAFSEVSFGPSAVLAYVSAPAAGAATVSALVCPARIPDCKDYLMNVIGDVYPCSFPERMFNVHVLLVLRPGSKRTFAESFLRSQGCHDGVDTAAALLFGSGEHSAVVEVVGDDLPQVCDALLDLTDLDVVVRADTHVVLAEHAHKWGSRQA